MENLIGESLLDVKFGKTTMRGQIAILICLLVVTLCACLYNHQDYGVFLSYEGDLERLSKYETVVIDAQYFEATEIEEFRNDGHKVYSYINIGSLENFRDYYAEYQDLTLDVYENWEDEKWVDATSKRWQSFILDELAPSLLAKDIDGFFVDNCDVYYMYQSDEMLDGVATIMKGLVATGKEVIMNGGDAFIEGYTENGGDFRDVITGINQESVFTRIDWETGSFHGSFKEDREYFLKHLGKYSDMGVDIYLLEYTKNPFIAMMVKNYCDKHGYKYYISNSLELGI